MVIVGFEGEVYGEEKFQLPNGYYIVMDYGLLDVHGLTNGIKNEFIGMSRYGGNQRRSILYDDENNVITQAIQDNPDRIPDEDIFHIHEDGLLVGDEYERVVNFDNGMVAKVEYWMTLDSRDENFGRYAAKFRRIVLFDKEQEVISEVFEKNPHYRKTGNKFVYTEYPDQDKYDIRDIIV